MRIDLTGKVAVVTGAASGIGRACALALAAAGATLVAVDINLDGAQETLALLDPPRPDALALRCDVRDPAAVAALADAVQARLGGADILVNSAGLVAYARGIGAVSVEQWDRVMQVNLRGAFLVCQALIEGMKARRDGRIINLASLAARVGGIEAGIHYAASKSGLIGLTRTLAKEGGPYGITANAVAPGIIATPPVMAQIAGHEESYTRQIPLGRLGQPEDVAHVVLFLASPLAAYVNGVVLDINGGQYMG
jgi:3-oxoacyl-[acyl-carrier protein] reductase